MKFSLILALFALLAIAYAQDTTTTEEGTGETCDPKEVDGCSEKWGLDYCCARHQQGDTTTYSCWSEAAVSTVNLGYKLFDDYEIVCSGEFLKTAAAAVVGLFALY